MADVRSTRDRGQLILVTGLAVAVTLVAMVLLLNTVIYTQNLASRGPQVDDGATVSFQGAARVGVADVVDAENRAEHGDWSAVSENVTHAVVRFDNLTADYYAERGTVARVETDTLSLTEGTLVRQTNASRAFMSAGNDASVDWTLVSDAGADGGPGVRDATVTVARANLSDDRASSFAVALTGDGGDEWVVRLYDSGTGVTVAVRNDTESSPHDACTASGPNATVDLTAGTLDGDPCPGLVWAEGVSAPYDVAFENGSAAAGTYALTVRNATGTTVRESNLAGPGDDASPRAVPAVYAARFEIHFETPTLRFHTTVRAARGEPR